MSAIEAMFAASDHGPLDARQQAALDALRARAKREARCPPCRGYGWRARAGLPAAGEPHASQVLICCCAARHRFRALALTDPQGVLAAMNLDADGRIASADGLYGRFGAQDRRLLHAVACTARPRAVHRPGSASGRLEAS
jgi:hypothetical protein